MGSDSVITLPTMAVTVVSGWMAAVAVRSCTQLLRAIPAVLATVIVVAPTLLAAVVVVTVSGGCAKTMRRSLTIGDWSSTPVSTMTPNADELNA